MHTPLFFKKISDAAFRPSTYKAHVKERTSTSLGYLYWLLVCSFTVTAIILAIFYIPARLAIRTFIDVSEPQLRTFYPAKLVLTLQSGSLSTNAKEPFIIDPPFWATLQKENDDTANVPAHFITIDTQASVEDFSRYNSAILLTESHLVTQEDQQLRVYAFSEMQENFVIDKTAYDAFIDQLMPFLHAAPAWIDLTVVVGLLLLPFVGAGFAWVWYLFILLLWSLILWAISSVMGKGLLYSQLYRLGAYGLTLSIVYKTIFGFLPGMVIPFSPTLIFFVFMIIVLKQLPSPTMPAPKKAKEVTKKVPKKTVKKPVKIEKN